MGPSLSRIAGEGLVERFGLGVDALQLLEAQATLGTPVRRSPRREQAMRVRLEREGGQTVAFPNGAQGSHILTSLVGADALAMIPAGEGTLEAGATVALEELAS